jgi:hypothetical protein
MGKTIPYRDAYVRIEIRKHGNTYSLRTIVEREGEREPLLNASKNAKCAKLLVVVVVGWWICEMPRHYSHRCHRQISDLSQF